MSDPLSLTLGVLAVLSLLACVVSMLRASPAASTPPDAASAGNGLPVVRASGRGQPDAWQPTILQPVLRPGRRPFRSASAEAEPRRSRPLAGSA